MNRYLLSLAILAAAPFVSHADTNEEIRLGNLFDIVQVSTSVLVLDEIPNRTVTRIGEDLAQYAGRDDLEYTFRIVNSPVANAFATSGGFVYINSGLLDICESRDEVAAVLAHELAHTTDAHAVASIRSSHRRDILGRVLGTTAGALLGAMAASEMGVSPNSRFSGDLINLGMEAGVAVAQLTVDVSKEGYAKKLELHADGRAVELMMAADYEPAAMISLLKKLQRLRDGMGASERKTYASALINKKPGLDERLSLIQTQLAAPSP